MMLDRQTHLRPTLAFFVWVQIIVLLATACSAGLTRADAVAAEGDDAIQLPEETRSYIDVSRIKLAQQLGVDPEQIELESMAEPGRSGGSYIIRLVADGIAYEYHGRGGAFHLLSITEPEPTR